LRFRPEDDPHPGSPVEWTDNWLSNFFAWGSKTFTPSWCQSKDHWSSRITQYVFTDCPCCLFFRGLIIGGLLVLPFWIIVIVVLLSLW